MEEFNREWDDRRAYLENEYKVDKAVIHHLYKNPSIRSEKLRLFDKEFAKKIEEHERDKDIHLKELKSTLLAADVDAKTETSVSVGNLGDKMAETPLELDGGRVQDQSKERGSLGIGDGSGNDVESLEADLNQEKNSNGDGNGVEVVDHVDDTGETGVPGGDEIREHEEDRTRKQDEAHAENQTDTQPANETTCENDVNTPETSTQPPEINLFDLPNQVAVAPRIPNHGDPLQAELERLFAHRDNVTKFYDDLKQRMISERDKEIADMIAQITLKYETKFKGAEEAFQLRKKELDTTVNRVAMNKILAEAFRAKCYKHEFLKDFFLSTGQLHDVAYLLWKESWELAKNPMETRGSPLHTPRIKLIEKSQNLFAETKEHFFESKVAEEHARLLRLAGYICLSECFFFRSIILPPSHLNYKGKASELRHLWWWRSC
ncbi:unnamed protein product [Lactuca virosa]|uniref:Uncharacterized protein n=1 Tax=Lactuca virosa TaxID=75947 RepID=A0AAU9LLD2_9ASTR|nr:unnamed protein product [Lactuca virosa]